MQIIRAYWKPDIAILPCGGINTMDAEQAAFAAGELLGVSVAIPFHYYLPPETSPYPDATRAALARRPAMA